MKLQMAVWVVFALLISGHVSADEGGMVVTTEVVISDVQDVQDEGVMPMAVNVGNKICPVGGEKIDGSMGEVGQYQHNGKIYNLCCKMCLKDFENNPEKYSKIADQEVAKSGQ